MILFFHIEKTAGSSFRDSCLDHFGEANCETLYGPKSRSTSPALRSLVYPDGPNALTPRERIARTLAFIESRRPAFFSSHVLHVVRHRLPADAKTIAFFREPVARLASHYNHWRLQGYFEGTFEEFVSDPKFQNWQSKRFSIDEMRGLDCVGISEAFEASLAMVNALFELNLRSIHKNKTPWRPFQISAKRLDPAMRERIEMLNAEDVELYHAASKRFAQDTRRWL